MDGGRQRWLPLESNPEVMTKFVHDLGVSKDWQYTDIYGLDDDLLAMVPQPVAAVLLLFPINEPYERYRQEEQARIEASGQEVSKNVIFVKQTISNACGTIALIHSVCNNADRIPLGSGFFARVAEEAKTKSPAELAQLLEEDTQLAQVHEVHAQSGQTENVTQAPPLEEEINLHFIAFVHRDGSLYELDGRKPFPINHGPSSDDTLLKDATAVVRAFMDRDPTNLQFTMIALAPAVEA